MKEVGDVARCVFERRGGNCYSAFQGTDFDDNRTGRNIKLDPCDGPKTCNGACFDLTKDFEGDGPARPFNFLSPEGEAGE